MANEIAHQDGYRAGMNALPECANPFLFGSANWRAWVAGRAAWLAGA